MHYYILAFAIYSAALFFLIRNATKRYGVVIFLLGLLPVFLLAVCRGNVGTDTAAYLQIIADIEHNDPPGLELGFVLLIKALLFLGISPQFILVTIACLATALLIYAAQFSKRSLILSAVCFVPVFYLDMTMNGLRYGLSFACIMCATGLFYQRRFYLCVIFASCAVLFHLSGWLILLMMVLFSDDKEEFRRWFVIATGLGVLLLALQNIDEILYLFNLDIDKSGVDLESKFSAYMGFPSPSLLSGLGPLTLSLLALWLIRKTDRANYDVCTRRFYMLLVGVIGAFVVAKFSYAGLRLQFVVLFFLLLCLQFKPAFSTLDVTGKSRGILVCMLLIGLLGIAAFMKNALMTEGAGPSPWLPYSVNPELMDKLDVDR